MKADVIVASYLFTASSKHVSWLLGRDGDVSVSVIGEVDEFRSSKLLQSLINNRSIHRNTQAPRIDQDVSFFTYYDQSYILQ